MGKTKADLLKSRSERKKMIDFYGFMPLSILEIKRGKTPFFQYQEEKKAGSQHKKDGQYSKEFNASCKGSRGGENFTIMPTGLVEFAIRYWCGKDDIYLDPFAGQGVQMQVAHKYGLRYIGYDICKKFMVFNRAVASKLKNNKLIDLYERDARTIGEEAKDWTFCFTSPPYWDTEEYDNHPDQLGINKDYDEFLKGVTDVYRAMYKQAKNGAIAIINVNDFRKDGVFYSYHSDTIRSLQKAGFTITDTAVLSGGCVSGIAQAFATDFNKRKILPKVHEYLIIAKK